MLARILFLPDLHKRGKDSDSISGQVEALKLIQEDIIKLNQQYHFTHNIILGDWYHKGFHEIGQAWGAIQEDRKLSESVDGNVYIVIGNHFYLERDSNPEMYTIQPNPYIKPVHEFTMPEKPIFQYVKYLRIGNVQIDFHHFSKVDKDYVHERLEGVTYRIGLFHDDKTLPSWVREKAGYMSGAVSQVYLNKIYEDLDLAIHGHIHTPIGVVKMALADGREVPAIIPGSLSIVTQKQTDVHDFVDLPVIEIDDDSNVSVKVLKQSTHRECLVFKAKSSIQDVSGPQSTNIEKTFTPGALNSVTSYLTQKGHSQETIDLIHQIYTTPMSIEDMVGYLRRRDDERSAVSI